MVLTTHPSSRAEFKIFFITVVVKSRTLLSCVRVIAMPYGHTFSQLSVSQAYGPYCFLHDSQIQEAGYFVSRNVFHNFRILANN